MANIRQYIGARYVFKIYENSQDPSSAEWEANVTYEPLTIVTYLNSTYTSKKDVPGSVGNPAANPQYWIVTGAYNGQIAALQQQIDTINNTSLPNINLAIQALSNAIDTINNTTIPDLQNQINTRNNLWHNKNIVVYGDSLSTVTHQFWQYMVELDPTINVTNRAVAGSRIDDGVTLLQNASDLAYFDIIVLQYGTNSWQGTSLKNMITQYKTAINTISTRAPLAQLVCIAPYYSYRSDYGTSTINTLGFGIYDYSRAICHVCSMYGGISFNLYDLCGVNQYNYTSYLENSSGVYVHENEILGRKIANILLHDYIHTGELTSYYQLDLTNSGTLHFRKNNGYTLITQVGFCSVSDMEALSIPELAGGYGTQSLVRGHQSGNIALCVLTAAGTFAFSGLDASDTTIEGLNMMVFNSSMQPT